MGIPCCVSMIHVSRGSRRARVTLVYGVTFLQLDLRSKQQPSYLTSASCRSLMFQSILYFPSLIIV
uniref:Ovule protein n=1 Tax=Heterorhabditis bacteriophora TaxID=37862 RepID=A0A1I7XAD6_HETBA